MAITVVEANDSRQWNGDDVTMKYHVAGTANDAFAMLALYDVLPLWVSHPITGVKCYLSGRADLDPDFADEDNGRGLFHATAVYQPPIANDRGLYPIGSLQLTIDTTGGTKHTAVSINTMRSYSAVAGTTPPDHKGAIGRTKDGSPPEGVDVPSRAFSLRAEKIWSLTSLPNWDTIYGLTGTVNDGSITLTDTGTGEALTFAAGELLFRGAQKSGLRDDGGLPVVYQFDASPNVTNLTIGGGRFDPITKGGWEYLWVQFGTVKSNNHLIEVPMFAYVDQVIESGDHDGLGIHT